MVSGYLLFNSLKRTFEASGFNYWKFIFRKVIRLWPLIVLSIIVAIIMGYYLMLPDDYENLAESAIASSVFANNILQCITTKNYWNIANMFKPLMHLWYVGVLMQAYALIPLVLLILDRVSKKYGFTIGTIGMTIVSIFCYILPFFSTAWKFYLLPFRIFEITSGGLLTIYKREANDRIKKVIGFGSIIVILLLICSRGVLVSGSTMLLATVISTVLFIWASKEKQLNSKFRYIVQALAFMGERSYSVYIWHQIIIAFMFYSLFAKHDVVALLVFVGASVLISLISYRFIEIPIGNVIGRTKKESAVIIINLIVAVTLCVLSVAIYHNAGVVRDVPELDIYKNNVHRGMHAEYCDRPFAWNKEFDDDEKINALVIGNSYSRDWANILYEWDSQKQLDISYLYYGDVYGDKELLEFADRIEQADIVFSSQFEGVANITVIPPEKYFIIGNKRYGESNGIIYAHRHSPDYYLQTVEYKENIQVDNENGKDVFGDHFISLMDPVIISENRIKVFTDDNKFLSQDCMHLTRAGAIYYSRILDIGKILDGV